MAHAALQVTTCISAALQVKCYVETKNFFLCGLKATVLYQMWFCSSWSISRELHWLDSHE